MKVKELNKEERPREKALQHGIAALSNRELLALVLRSGTRSMSALELADEVLRHWSSMGDLGKANMQELMGLSGIKEAKAISFWRHLSWDAESPLMRCCMHRASIIRRIFWNGSISRSAMNSRSIFSYCSSIRKIS